MAERWWREARYALRALRRTPTFALVAIATLALGIGANTAILAVVDAVILRPLPYAEPDRLVMVWEDASALGYPRNTPAPANYLSWLAMTRSFSGMAATRNALANLTSDGPPEQLLGRRVTASFFTVLGVQPLVGRTFTEDEDRLNAPVTVISYGLWRRRYAGDRQMVGTSILMNGERRTVIGVMPSSFMFRSRDMDFWNPMAFTPDEAAMRNSHILNVVARLAPGVTLESARADLRDAAERLQREFPRSNANLGAVAEPLKSDLLGNANLQLLVLLAGAGCLLLIACANVASLLLSRALSRRGELAIRVSLGATTPAIVSQLMVEAMLLALSGGALGLVMGPVGARLLSGLVPTGLPAVQPAIDPRLLATAFGLAVGTGVLFGAAPALQIARASVGEALQQTGRGGVGGRSRLSRDVLVVAQVASAVVLLVSAGLLVRTFDKLRQLELGFHPDRIVTMRTPLPSPKYADPTNRLTFYERVVDDVRRLPGVQNAAYVSVVPFGSQGNSLYYQIEGQPADGARDALYRVSTNHYLETVGAQLIEGRLPGDQDQRDAPFVVVINSSFAALHWPGASPIGAQIRFGTAKEPPRTVVGVIRDMRERGYSLGDKPAAYVPYSQVLTSWYPETLIVRAAADPQPLLPAIRRVIGAVDPEQPIAGVRPLQDLIDLDVVARREQTILLSLFAGLALLLAGLGLYGVLAHAVTERRREIAVRMALGASVPSVMGLVAIRSQLLVATGLGIGLALAFAATRILQTLLYGVTATDPLTFTAAVAVLGAVSMMAAGIPALRAARLDPASVLKDS